MIFSEATSQQAGRPATILSLQAIRTITCIVIFIYHATGISPLGQWGVSVFFVLSGFVLVYSYWERPISFTSKTALLFSINRIKKLFPLHVLMLVFGFVREIIVNRETCYRLVPKLCITVPLLQTWFPRNYQALNSVDWYLSVTVFLYFMFPAILDYLKKNMPVRQKVFILIASTFLLQIILGFLANRYLSGIEIKWIVYCFPPYRLGDFFIGCLMGYLFINHEKPQICKTIATIMEFSIVCCIVGSWILSRTILKQYDWFNYTCLFVPTSICLIYFFAHEQGMLSKILVNKFTLFFAKISPFFFLLHRQLLYYMQYGVKYFFHVNLNAWTLALFSFPIALCMSILFQKFDSRSIAIKLRKHIR